MRAGLPCLVSVRHFYLAGQTLQGGCSYIVGVRSHNRHHPKGVSGAGIHQRKIFPALHYGKVSGREKCARVVDQCAPWQQMQLRASGLDDEAPRLTGLANELAQQRADSDKRLIELMGQAADGGRIAVAFRIVIDVAVPQLAIELAPLLVIDRRPEILRGAGDTLDHENDAEIALRRQRETAFRSTTE